MDIYTEYGLIGGILLLILDRAFPKGIFRSIYDAIIRRSDAVLKDTENRREYELQQGRSIIDQALDENRTASEWLRNIISSNLQQNYNILLEIKNQNSQIYGNVDVLSRYVTEILDEVSTIKNTIDELNSKNQEKE